MKNAILALMLIFAAASTLRADVCPVEVVDGNGNVVVYDLTDESTDLVLGRDSLAIAGWNVYGPIPIEDGKGRRYLYMGVQAAQGAISTGDSVQIEYQGLISPALAESTSTWDTLASDVKIGGKVEKGIDLSTKAIRYVWVKVRNLSASATQLTGRIRLSLAR
jgi:hypothetical protein